MDNLMPQGIYKVSYSSTLQTGLLGQEVTTEGSGILVFQMNQIIGYVQEGKKQRLLEGSYIKDRKIRKKSTYFVCKLWTQKPIKGTFGEEWETEEEKNFRLELIIPANETISSCECISTIPQGQVKVQLKFLLGFSH